MEAVSLPCRPSASYTPFSDRSSPVPHFLSTRMMSKPALLPLGPVTNPRGSHTDGLVRASPLLYLSDCYP